MNIATATKSINSLETISQDNFRYSDSLEQLVYEFEIQPGFKECANLSRGVYFTSYLSWIGKVRELFMSEIGDKLVPQISSGDWGLVTNWCELNVYGEATTYDHILARFWLGNIVGAVIPLQCEFIKIREDGSQERLAFVEQETTWVEVIGHGKVKPAEFPAYFSEFLKKTGRNNQNSVELESMYEGLSRLKKGNEIFKAPTIPGDKFCLFSECFNTALEDANLVGNVYYGNYFIWQGRVRDLYINSIANEFMRGIGEEGEMICIRSRLDYLRDAMPFDRVEVCLSVNAVYECCAMFDFQYYRIHEDGTKEKLAVGKQEFVWSKYDEDGKRISTPLPEVIVESLISKV